MTTLSNAEQQQATILIAKAEEAIKEIQSLVADIEKNDVDFDDVGGCDDWYNVDFIERDLKECIDALNKGDEHRLSWFFKKDAISTIETHHEEIVAPLASIRKDLAEELAQS